MGNIIKQKVEAVQARFDAVIKETGTELSFTKESAFAIQAIQSNKLLAGCDHTSLQKAVLNVALSGLSLNPVLGLSYIVPRKTGGRMNACLDISYKGMIKILTDTGSVKSISAQIVYSNDQFDIEFGLDPKLVHKPNVLNPERGEMVGAYSVAILHDGTKDFIFMRRDELDKVKSTSQFSGKNSIWDKWSDEMYKKTVIKRHFKTLPKSDKLEQMAEVIDIDNKTSGFDSKPSETFDDIFDAQEAEIVPDVETPAKDEKTPEKRKKAPSAKKSDAQPATTDKDGQGQLL